MRNESIFRVARLPFSVILPEGWEVETLLPSFRPFRCGACPEEKLAFRLEAVEPPFFSDGQDVELLDESSNDLGHVRLLRCAEGYRMEIDYGDTVRHTLVASPSFDRATACLRREDPYVATALSSMLRILFAQAVLRYDGVSLHASCVCLEGKSYLFLGKSGTGKSTHARQWLESFPGCILLNDDNPAVRVGEDGIVTAYGTPWSGKTPCYKNESCPVVGIARLRQSKVNCFTPLEGPEAFAALLPSCSAIRQDKQLQDALYCTLIRIAEQVSIGKMECLPDREAARVAFSGQVDE